MSAAPTEFEQLPLHSAFLAIARKVIAFRYLDRQLHPRRSWQTVIDHFWDAARDVRCSALFQRQTLKDPARPMLSTRGTLQEADDCLDGIEWPDDPDTAMAELGRVWERYVGRVPLELVQAHLASEGARVRTDLETPEGLRYYLDYVWHFHAEDSMSRGNEDQDR